MSILRRILGGGEGERSEDGPDWIDLGDQRGELPEGALPLRASGGGLRLVGESHYREAIAAVAGGRRRQSVKLVTWASLVPEPENPYDTNAVGAYIDGHKVGHLSRQDAAAFAPVLARITAAGLTAYARADIFGGWDRGPSDRGDYGITVYASPADEQARMLDRRLDGKSARDVAATTPAMRAGRKQGPGMVRGRPHSDWHPEVKRLADLGDDSAAEPLLDEQRDHAAMVEVGVGQQKDVDARRVEGEAVAVMVALGGTALEHAAVHEHPRPIGRQEVLRPRHGPGGAEELDLHARPLVQGFPGSHRSERSRRVRTAYPAGEPGK